MVCYIFQLCSKDVVKGLVDKERGDSDLDPGLPHNDHVTLTIPYVKPVGYLFSCLIKWILWLGMQDSVAFYGLVFNFTILKLDLLV